MSEDVNLNAEILEELKAHTIILNKLVEQQEAMQKIMAAWQDSDAKHHTEESNTLKLVQDGLKKTTKRCDK